MVEPLNRREFLIAGAAAAGSAAMLGGLQALLTASEQRSATTDLVTSKSDQIVPSVCLLCPSGCGMLGRVADGNLVKLEGSPMHPINQGALCPKGQAAVELLYNPDRLTGPLRRAGERGAGQWEPISWDLAVQLIADRLGDLRADGHPERAALMHGEAQGQLAGFLRRFMQTFGSPNIVSRESLNLAAAKTGMYLTQGVYDMPAYDLENSTYVLSFGANLLEAGQVPQRMVSGYAYMRRGRADRGKVVVFDPRQGITGAKADEWIPINPGTDAALALGMANVIVQSGLIDSSFVKNYCFGFDDFPDESEQRLIKGFKSFVADNYAPEKVEKITGVPASTIARIAGEFAGNQPGVAILPGKGGLLNGSFGGVYAAMAVHALNALVGNIDRPGGVLVQRLPLMPDWPDIPTDDLASRACESPRVDGAGSRFPLGRSAYAAVADRVLDGYPVDTLFLYDANPVYETPGGDRFITAFEEIPLIVSFSSFMDESALHADLVLPEPTFLERYEDHFFEGLGYSGVGLRQPVVEPLYDTRSVGDFFLSVARKMGGPLASAFPWQSYKDVLQYRLQDVGPDWETLLELGVWMIPGYRYARRGSEKWVSEVVGKDRQGAPRDGYFDFFSRELRCLFSEQDPAALEQLGITARNEDIYLPHYEPVSYIGEQAAYPFTLNIVTLMSLGPYSQAANLPTLQEISGMTVGERWDSWLEMNPESAHEHGLADLDAVWVESIFGKLQTRVRFVKGLHPGVVNLPHNLGHSAGGRFASGRGVNGLSILNPNPEPLTGLSAFTNTRVRVYRA